MKLSGLGAIILCLLFLPQTNAQEGLPDDFIYLFPGPGAEYVDTSSSIIIRFRDITPSEISNPDICIAVVGEESGSHPGHIIIASDKKTLIFKPETAYKPGELVKVHLDFSLSESSSKSIEKLDYEFSVIKEVLDSLSSTDENTEKEELRKKSFQQGPVLMSNGVSVPSDFPHVNITTSNNPSDDYIYVTTGASPNYNVIYNTDGDPVWYYRSKNRWGDFTLQPNGWITMFMNDGYGSGEESFVAFDQNFEFIKSMSATDGYQTDEHDFYMFPDNGYMLIGKKVIVVDMSQYVEGGKVDANVVETCVQEFSADDQLIHIWRAWDHFDINDLDLDSPLNEVIRFPHINAIWEDEDGHLLISSRHMSEISKVDRESGDFIWRLSGNPDSPNNDFLFLRDPKNGFRNQHAIQSSGPNRYTLFDNGNLHLVPKSRSVEYQLDTVAMTATMIWEYENDIGTGYTGHLGNTHSLPNGNKHINWAYGASFPIANEITPQGEKVFEMWFTIGDRTYRTHRNPWTGKRKSPYLILEANVYGATLIFNKFGDDNVDYYKIYGGPTPEPTNLIDTSGTSLKHLLDLQNGAKYYFRVSAVDMQGIESDYSNEESLTINSAEPGGNIIKNGDFSSGEDYWDWYVDSTVSANISFNHGLCRIEIQDGGASFNNIILQQHSIPLFQGQSYKLEYEVRSDASRFFEIVLGSNGLPFKDYSRIGFSQIDTRLRKYSHIFEMEDASDLFSKIAIYAGGGSENIYIDNISLSINDPTSIETNIAAGDGFYVYQNFPNPVRSITQIKYVLPENSFVSLKIYNPSGQVVANYLNNEQIRGEHYKDLNLERLAPGVYYYSLEARPVNSPGYYLKTNKMILIK